MIDIATARTVSLTDQPGSPSACPAPSATTTTSEGTQMPRHTTMPPRIQNTPHGDVSLTSKWDRDHYLLQASGSLEALTWMFPKMVRPERHTACFRHAFTPARQQITVERDLRQACARWQAHWDERMTDGFDATALPVKPIHPQTLKETFDYHQAHYATLLASKTREQYPARLQDWFTYLGQDIRLEDLTTEGLLAARDQMQKARRSSNATVNGKLASLKKILNMAHRKGWVAQAVWRDVPPLRLVREPVRYWNAEQVAVAFAVAKDDPYASRAILMLVLGIYLGLRKNEAVHVRWQDLHLDRMHPTTGKPSPICLIEQREGFTTKTYENRKVPVSEECKRLLLDNRPAKAKPTDYVLDPQSHRPKRGGTKRVYRYDPFRVWLRVRKAAMAKGNPHIEFMEMRHSFACNCLLKGHSVEKVARWLGHKDPRMVRQHYAFLLDYDDDTELRFLDED